eukprot:15328818-Ditylum_brightwellii.AAC.2
MDSEPNNEKQTKANQKRNAAVALHYELRNSQESKHQGGTVSLFHTSCVGIEKFVASFVVVVS